MTGLFFVPFWQYSTRTGLQYQIEEKHQIDLVQNFG
jgi:hypothetical protein